MAAAVAKSRPQPAAAHVEWWSPQQALTMILTGDEVAATAAAGQAFADFVEEMKRRGLAEWIDEALSELRAGVLLGAISDERIQREQCVPEDAPCIARGLPGSGTANAPRRIDATVLLRPGDFSASRPMPINGEVVFGAPNHVEWRALEFERSGVKRAARWACREGWLKRRMADIDELVVEDELSMLSCVHVLMMKMRQDGRRLAAIIDEDFPQADLVPTRMQNPRWNKRPPLWLMRQEPETAEETWAAAHEIFDEARSLLLKALKAGRLEAYSKDKDRGTLVSANHFKCEKAFIFPSTIGKLSNIYIEKAHVEKITIAQPHRTMASTSAHLLRLQKQLADHLRQAGPEADNHAKIYWASKVGLKPESRDFRNVWRGAREDAGLPPRPAAGPKRKMAVVI